MRAIDRLLREPEVARITGLSVHTLRQWRSVNSQGKGPDWVKQGRTVAYRESDVQSWIEGLSRTT